MAHSPRRPMRPAAVVDLARDGGTWIGSVIVPGRGVKGATLNALQVDETGVRFGLDAAMRFAPEPAPRAVLRFAADGTLAGEFTQAGHRAALALQRSGPPQVDRPVTPTPITAALPGQWRGRYELGGYPRQVTLTLQRTADGFGRGELVIVGKRTTTLPIDHIVQSDAFVTLRSTAADIRIEGRLADGAIDGQLVQGPFDAPLHLKRDAGSGS
jgi:hypothetical protein